MKKDRIAYQAMLHVVSKHIEVQPQQTMNSKVFRQESTSVTMLAT